MTNYSIIIPSDTVGPEAYREIPARCALYGKNAVVKAKNLNKGGTAIERNSQIGGHKA